MKLSWFVTFILILTMGWMQVYSSVHQIFSGTTEYKAEIAHLNARIQENHIARALEKEQFLEFRQYVATLMPDVLKTKGHGVKGYPYRTLASVVTHSDATQIRDVIAKTLFERGKEHFRKRHYVRAIQDFHQIVENFGYTPYVVESYFLWAESLYQENQLEDCTRVIQKMIDLFPSDELTGFAMVRLGSIYERQNRTEDAISVYKTVLRSYPQRGVASQARASLKDLDL